MLIRSLTDHVDDIITRVYQYINMLKREGPQRWIFEEGRDINLMNFKFKDVYNPSALTVSLASVMRVSAYLRTHHVCLCITE